MHTWEEDWRTEDAEGGRHVWGVGGGGVARVVCQEEMGDRSGEGQGVQMRHQDKFYVYFWGFSPLPIKSTI